MTIAQRRLAFLAATLLIALAVFGLCAHRVDAAPAGPAGGPRPPAATAAVA